MFNCELCDRSDDYCTCGIGYRHAMEQNLKKEVKEKLARLEKENQELRLNNADIKRKYSDISYTVTSAFSNSKCARRSFEELDLNALTIKDITLILQNLKRLEDNLLALNNKVNK
jgi:hypothetical protein